MLNDFIYGKSICDIAAATAGNGKLPAKLVSFVNQQNLCLFSAAPIAAINPEGPPPITITSYFMVSPTYLNSLSTQ